MSEKSNEVQEAKVARLEEEKAILWAIVSGLEDWMFGEGCFVSERIKAKLAIARALMAPVEQDLDLYRRRIMNCYIEDRNPKPKRGRPANKKKEKKGWTPETRAAQAERGRQRMKAYWAERRGQVAGVDKNQQVSG